MSWNEISQAVHYCIPQHNKELRQKMILMMKNESSNVVYKTARRFPVILIVDEVIICSRQIRMVTFLLLLPKMNKIKLIKKYLMQNYNKKIKNFHVTFLENRLFFLGNDRSPPGPSRFENALLTFHLRFIQRTRNDYR